MTGHSDADISVAPLPLEISPDALVAFQRENRPHAILDVREAWELDICRLKDCLHIPLGDLRERIDELPKGQTIVVVCHHGQRSLMATRFLRDAGVPAANLIGGVDVWATMIDPGMERY